LHQLPRLDSEPLAEGESAPAQSFRGWFDRALERKHAAR